MSNIKASIKFIRDIPLEKLQIPNYQRPYKWKKENVIQLLKDIENSLNKSEYRIGSIILHENEGSLDIVDGQQRITTLVLLMKALGIKISNFRVKYPHQESKFNIKENYATILNWCNSHLQGSHKTDYIQFLRKQCSFVWIEVDDISEAFQMFDSQNGRGRPLEAYNLLKAFHLRAMDKNKNTIEITDEKINYDKAWESCTKQNSKEDYLTIITEILYRIRLWSRRKYAYHFDKSKLNEFKGIQIDEISYPCQNIAKLIYNQLYKNTDNLEKELLQRNSVDDESARALIQGINDPIINGSPFFEFILSEVKNYKFLFIDENRDPDLTEFRKDYKQYCLYPGYGGAGNTYVRNLYEALILLIYDKFGVKGVKEIYPTLYLLAYRLRLTNKQVRFTTVAKYPIDIFETIQSSWSIENLISLTSEARTEVGIRLYNDQIKSILPFFEQQKITVKAQETLKDGNKTIAEIGQILQRNGKFE